MKMKKINKMQIDFLSRKPYINLLKSIIVNQLDNPHGYSFAVDGEWGCGKTWILMELENQLVEDAEHNFLIFHYNAWENDFYEEPLVAILSVMIESLKIFKKTIKETGSIGKVITSSISTLTKVAGSFVEKKYSINPNDVIDSIRDSGKAISDVKLSKSDFNNMLPLENALKQIKAVITKFTGNHKILFIVDELDRCLPEYSIKVLERLHHICYEIPVIQIIAYSGKAMANSVAQVYGGNISDEQSKKAYCSHFMEKFVNLVVPLNLGIPDKNISTMYEGIEESYEPMFDDSEAFLINFYMLFLREIPIRNRKQILETVKMIHELTLASNDFKNFSITYELLCSEIIIVIDRIFLHAQSPFNINYTEEENVLALNFLGEETSRYSEIIPLDIFKSMIQEICIPFHKEQDQMWKKVWYTVNAGSCVSIVFLIFADGKNLQVNSEYSYLLGRPSIEIITQSKQFIEKFYSLLYQFT